MTGSVYVFGAGATGPDVYQALGSISDSEAVRSDAY